MLWGYYRRPILDRVSSEQGIYIPFVALALVALIGIAGLAFDSGKVFLYKRRVQNAVELAALATAERSLGVGGRGSGEFDPRIIERRAQELVIANLVGSGIPQSELDTSNGFFEVTPRASQGANGGGIEVEISAGWQQLPTLFLGALPGMQRSTRVFANSKGVIRTLRVVLLFDYSRSMNDCLGQRPNWQQPNWGGCGRGTPSCGYRQPVDHPDRKMNIAIEQAQRFVDILAQPGDQFAVVGFGRSLSTPLSLMQPIVGNALDTEKEVIKNAIETLRDKPANSTQCQNTWIHNGLLEAQRQINSRPRLPNQDVAVVFLSDGAAYMDNLAMGIGSIPDERTGAAVCGGYSTTSRKQHLRADQMRTPVTRAIQVSDALRDDGIRIFGISFGNLDRNVLDVGYGGGNQPSPYQNAEDTDSVKPIQIARIAKDALWLQFPVIETTAHGRVQYDNPSLATGQMQWDFDCTRPVQIGSGASGFAGVYAHAEDAQALFRAYNRIAQYFRVGLATP